MSRPLHVQLLIFAGCPLADAARSNLQAALLEFEQISFEEIDILEADAPDQLRAWGSPTILIDGCDITGELAGNSVCCRVYETPQKVPTVAMIANRIRNQLTTEKQPL